MIVLPQASRYIFQISFHNKVDKMGDKSPQAGPGGGYYRRRSSENCRDNHQYQLDMAREMMETWQMMTDETIYP